MKRPNIILLMTDQLRGDCLGYAGHPDVKTPYLDTLASRALFSTAPTVPVQAVSLPEPLSIPVWNRATTAELDTKIIFPGIIPYYGR